MFFYIGNNKPLQALEQVDTNLFLDKGWNNVGSIWYKGYSTDCVLSENLQNIIEGYQPAGKYCVISNNKVYHPLLRGFPLWKLNDSLANLKLEGYDFVKNTMVPPVNSDIISLDEASTIIGNILLENTQNFFKYNNIEVMNVLFSGGLDTLTSWAVLDSVTKNYVLEIYAPDMDDTTFHSQMGRIREYENDLTSKVSKDYWGYDISSFYSNTKWYITGYYAEPIQLRGGITMNALARYKNKTIDEIAKPEEYLYWFLKRQNIIDKFKNSMHSFKDDNELKQFAYKAIMPDYQMWHIDNNMTFSPFYDIRITNTMMKLSIDDITTNAMNGTIQKNIVSRFNPQLLSVLSDYKNEKDVWKNLKKKFHSLVLDSNVKLNLRKFPNVYTTNVC
jgi:hypothetical protein